MAKWKDSHLPRVRFSSVRFPVLGHEENQTERVRSTQIFSLLEADGTGLMKNRARIGLSYDPDNADVPADPAFIWIATLFLTFATRYPAV